MDFSIFIKIHNGYTKDTSKIYNEDKGGKDMSEKILLVEDDSQIREVILDYFNSKSEGKLEIITASDGAKGLEFIESSSEADLVILDIMLPEIDGFTLCRELRKRSDCPVLFLTARGREEDILYGYELGCDDYMVKPFSMPELYAKINALLRRSKGRTINRELTCCGILMKPAEYFVSSDGKEIQLPPKEYALLKYFLEHKNCIVSRSLLLDKIWGYDFYGTDRVVDNHIKKLRNALGKNGKCIHTVISMGYIMKDKGDENEIKKTKENETQKKT